MLRPSSTVPDRTRQPSGAVAERARLPLPLQVAKPASQADAADRNQLSERNRSSLVGLRVPEHSPTVLGRPEPF
jgi:hypothetical protein